MSTCGDRRRGDKYVTVIIDLTAVRAGTGRPGARHGRRTLQAFKTWLASEKSPGARRWRVVAMDGFTGTRPPPARGCEAVAVMDRSTSVRLGADALERAGSRVQLDTCGHRGRKSDPCAARRTLHRRRPAHR